jgi:hypothetical protein
LGGLALVCQSSLLRLSSLLCGSACLCTGLIEFNIFDQAAVRFLLKQALPNLIRHQRVSALGLGVLKRGEDRR